MAGILVMAYPTNIFWNTFLSLIYHIHSFSFSWTAGINSVLLGSDADKVSTRFCGLMI